MGEMSFQPNDYLNGLNLDFENFSPEAGGQVNLSDIDLFTLSDFFDLDGLTKEKLDFVGNPSTEYKPTFRTPAKEQKKAFKRASTSDSINDIDVESYKIGKESENSFLDDDKRKRNTAASARFRIKKKVKEQEMEQKTKELEERANNLQDKIKMLEMENKCLRGLILQHNQQKNDSLLDTIKQRSALNSNLLL